VVKLEGEHLDPTAEITLETVKARAVKGVAVLTGRTFLLSLLALVAIGFLGAFLTESQFGIFFIVSAIINFLAYFSDIGLAAALIQKKEKVTETDLRTTFTIQQGLVLILLLGLVLATPVFARVYSLSPEGKMLLYALGVSLLLSSLKTIPSILLERELDFSRLVIPQVLENVVYHLVAVYFAWRGFGIMSFTYAVLARGVVGFIAIYLLRPWMPGLAFSKKSLKKLLKFGVPYQLNTFLATIKDDGMTVFLGGILGAAGIGILGWAQKWALYPLRLFMDHVLKVTFPAFARMQDEESQLAQSVSRSIFFVCFLVFPSVIGLLILAPHLIQIIPRYEKWQPALIPLALISVNTVFAAATTQLTNLFNAIGKIKITFKLMIMWTVLTWALVPFLAIRFGVNGAAAGYAIVGASSIVPIYIARRFVKYSLIDSVLKPGLSAVVMGLAMLFVRQVVPVSLLAVGLIALTGIASYGVTSYIIYGSSFIVDVKKIIKAIFSR
jgi:O-antigen/teichoic acid export membrane protein